MWNGLQTQIEFPTVHIFIIELDKPLQGKNYKLQTLDRLR